MNFPRHHLLPLLVAGQATRHAIMGRGAAAIGQARQMLHAFKGAGAKGTAPTEDMQCGQPLMQGQCGRLAFTLGAFQVVLNTVDFPLDDGRERI